VPAYQRLCLILRDCAIIFWRGGVLRLIGGPELKPKRRVGGGGKVFFLKIFVGGGEELKKTLSPPPSLLWFLVCAHFC